MVKFHKNFSAITGKRKCEKIRKITNKFSLPRRLKLVTTTSSQIRVLSDG